jgi:hypothetical protein
VSVEKIGSETGRLKRNKLTNGFKMRGETLLSDLEKKCSQQTTSKTCRKSQKARARVVLSATEGWVETVTGAQVDLRRCKLESQFCTTCEQSQEC